MGAVSEERKTELASLARKHIERYIRETAQFTEDEERYFLSVVEGIRAHVDEVGRPPSIFGEEVS